MDPRYSLIPCLSVHLKKYTLTMTWFLLFLSPLCYSQTMVLFDIPKQRADKALILFAKQAKKTIVFSFDLTKKYHANDIKGYYSTTAGLTQLLKNTGLKPVIGPSDQLSIKLDTHSREISDIHYDFPVTDETSTKENHIHNIEKIAITGSRVLGRSADDLPVPIDILSAQVLTDTGHTELGRMLQSTAPSFNFSTSAISDGTDVLRPATLRGLGPDQTLVLINGKRRHQASLIHINPSVGRGTAGVDINAIPVSAIKRVEVLRDGAAAQYGSDAIAGVINIVLDDSSKSGLLKAAYGQYSQGDGQSTQIDINKGFKLNSKGHLTASLNIQNSRPTNRAGKHGSCQFNSCIALGNELYLSEDSREIAADRTTFRIGDADIQHISFVANAGYSLSNGEMYGFITLSHRDNQSAAFFRHNGNEYGNAPLQDGDATIPMGFLPKINSKIKDLSFNYGFKTELANGANLDLSYTYGKNTIDYITSDTINASYANALQYTTDLSAQQIRETIPRTAYAYGMALSLQTVNFDYTQDFALFSLAMGAEIRTDQFSIKSGQAYSYFDYDTDELGNSLYQEDRGAGTQGFIGTAPAQAVKESRDVISYYADIETELTKNLIFSTAIRYDDYTDFGDSTNIKFASNWSLTPDFALRAAFSTGFRAPSMQQLYTNNISTQFITTPDGGDQKAVQIGIFRNDSDLAKAISIPKLKEEEAKNFSFGTVMKPHDNINLTIDFYTIYIKDRIVLSNSLGEGLSAELDAALKTNGVAAGQFFLNGADTETSGVDIVATYNTELLKNQFDVTLAGNFTETKITNIFTPSDTALDGIATEDIFSAQSISIIKEWQPKDRISLAAQYHIDDLQINLAFNRYGKYKVFDGEQQTFSAKWLTDLKIKYIINQDFSVNFGGNNIFDVYPDKNEIGNSHSGTIVDNQGNIIVTSPGVFTYSRRAAPFGFNGAYFYLAAEYIF